MKMSHKRVAGPKTSKNLTVQYCSCFVFHHIIRDLGWCMGHRGDLLPSWSCCVGYCWFMPSRSDRKILNKPSQPKYRQSRPKLPGNDHIYPHYQGTQQLESMIGPQLPPWQVGYVSRWWFQIFFIFSPIWGRFPFWLIFFRWVETTNQVFSFPGRVMYDFFSQDAWRNMPLSDGKYEASDQILASGDAMWCQFLLRIWGIRASLLNLGVSPFWHFLFQRCILEFLGKWVFFFHRWFVVPPWLRNCDSKRGVMEWHLGPINLCWHLRTCDASNLIWKMLTALRDYLDFVIIAKMYQSIYSVREHDTYCTFTYTFIHIYIIYT